MRASKRACCASSSSVAVIGSPQWGGRFPQYLPIGQLLTILAGRPGATSALGTPSMERDVTTNHRPADAEPANAADPRWSATNMAASDHATGHFGTWVQEQQRRGAGRSMRVRT